jgi:hypothetical protein
MYEITLIAASMPPYVTLSITLFHFDALMADLEFEGLIPESLEAVYP